MEIAGGKFDCYPSHVLFQTVELRRSRDRNNPRSLGEKPGERNLRGRRILPSRDVPERINQSRIRLPVFGRKARNLVAKIRTVERSVLVDLPGKNPSAEGAEWNEPNSKFFQSRDHFRFGLSPPE